LHDKQQQSFKVCEKIKLFKRQNKLENALLVENTILIKLVQKNEERFKRAKKL
jgi:hypothetical protein